MQIYVRGDHYEASDGMFTGVGNTRDEAVRDYYNKKNAPRRVSVTQEFKTDEVAVGENSTSQ